MQMRPLLILAADYANITSDGKLNVMGIFNDINAHNFPAKHPSMYLVARLGAEFGEYGQQRNFTVYLLDEDANKCLEIQGQFDIPRGEKGRRPEVNIIIDLKDVIFPKPGPYQFVILVEKDQKCELTLYANKIEAPIQAQE